MEENEPDVELVEEWSVFLVERITSLLVYALALLLAYQLIGRVVRNQYSFILVVYLGILAVFAFNYKPYVTADLYRLREYIEYWIYKDWGDAVRYANNSSSPAWVIYSYIISKLGNINWLQTITCMWCFGNVFYIIAHEIERYNIEGKYRSLLLLYIMAIGAFYLQTISGIRSMLGISIVAFCLYRETVERKSFITHFPLWLFAALIHTSTMILVISRFLFLIVQCQGVYKKMFMTAVVLALAMFSFKYLGDYISSSFEYGQSYLSNSKEYTYVWEIIIGLIEAIETFYVLIKYKRTAMSRSREPSECGGRDLYLFTLIWTVVSILALPFSYAIFRRYTMLCTLTSIPLVANLLDIDMDKAERKRTYNNLLILSIVIFVLSGLRGDLCGYKFFILE